jgi:hypothetical protein
MLLLLLLHNQHQVLQGSSKPTLGHEAVTLSIRQMLLLLLLLNKHQAPIIACCCCCCTCSTQL